MPSKINTLITSLVFVIGSLVYTNAAEINLPGFTGTANTTVTSGLSVRIERNCLTEPGAVAAAGDPDFVTKVNALTSDADYRAALLGSDTPGCAGQYTDGYGNAPDLTSGGRRSLLSANADDGNMNFDGGDVIDATQRLFTEISGSTDGGLDVNLSFVGSYNPINDINAPTWAPFTSAALDEIETNIDLLDAYITADIAEADATLTVGQYVTNWGESTFIPVGMNGLTTNAIDLTKLRVPGAAIREALVPAQQITLSGYLDGGWSYEAYYQNGETHIQVDQGGMFFGNEVVEGDRLTFTSAFRKGNQELAAACGLLISGSGAGQANQGCDSDAVTYYKSALGPLAGNQYLLQAGLSAVVSSDNAADILKKSAALGHGAAGASSIGGAAGDVQTLGVVDLAALGGSDGGITAVTAGYTNWDIYTRKAGRKVGTIDAAGGNHIYADGEDQYGLALRTYLDNIGSGVDVGIYYSQYDSKVPYFRFKGAQGVHGGDLVGIFTLAATVAAGGGTGGASFAGGSYLDNASGFGDGDISAAITGTETTAFQTLGAALTDIAYGEAACGAYQNPKAVNKLYGEDNAATASNFAWSAAQKTQALRYYNYTEIDGKLYHDSVKCYANAQNDGSGADFNTAATQNAAAALLGAAITPLNMAEYEFIYPENLKAMGISANTNIRGTTVQAEITYRPDFPLATSASDQGQQLSDSVGATGLLSVGVAQGVRQGCRDAYITDIDPSLDATDTADLITAAAATDTVAENLVLIGQHLAGSNTAPNVLVKCGAQNTGVTAYRDGPGDSDAEWADVVAALKNFNRSTLPRVSRATMIAGDYYTTPYLEYDVWSGTVGTTTNFTASHPIVTGMGADSAFLLTEVGFVHVPDLDFTRGGVNRGGYRDGVGGVKCGGVTEGGSYGATTYGGAGSRALDGVTHIGSSQTDPLFGNSSYCESVNTIDETSITYRLVGAATYNNIANTAWSFSPSFVWSHDISGYGPTSLGGFVPGRQSLSLTGNIEKGDVKVGLGYVNQLGDEMDNLAFDRDYISANVSYAF